MMSSSATSEGFPRRIYYVYLNSALARSKEVEEGGFASVWWALCERVRNMGFDAVMIPPPWAGARDFHGAPDDPDRSESWSAASESTESRVAQLSSTCGEHSLQLLVDLTLSRAARNGNLARVHPDWYENPRSQVIDPRGAIVTNVLELRVRNGSVPSGFVQEWAERLVRWVRAGVAGFRCREVAAFSSAVWKDLIQAVRIPDHECTFLAWTPGTTPEQAEALSGAGFNAVFSSLPWWDMRAPWLVDEHNRLGKTAPVLAPVLDPDDESPYSGYQGDRARKELTSRLWAGVLSGEGIMLPMGAEEFLGPGVIARVNKHVAERQSGTGPLSILTGPLAEVTVLWRSGMGVAINPDRQREAVLDCDMVRARLPDGCTDLERLTDAGAEPVAQDIALAAGGAAVFRGIRADPVMGGDGAASVGRKRISAAMRAPRIAIENVSPAVDDGEFPVKCTAGDTVEVQADVFMDGHDHIRALLLWRPADETDWREVPMEGPVNDRWTAHFIPTRIGRHQYTIRAWLDIWESWREPLKKKMLAGQDVSLEVEEGRVIIDAAKARARGNDALVEAIDKILEEIGRPQARRPATRRVGTPAARYASVLTQSKIGETTRDIVGKLLSDATAAVMEQAQARAFEISADVVYGLTVERRAARFASWYELFPRSCGPTPEVHGRFTDVMKRLPAIRDMGFDVLYFPPIHPIGLTNRKGKNNSLTAAPRDPGSPYAIGSPDGGHDSVHPELGTLDDFRALVARAREHHLEIAMDFAIQCSPDHPWLKDHPEWFAWRVDGSLRHAENPPKRYEDIVNPDFYSPLATASRQAQLWQALRDVILFWVDQGVHIFRVDNPHTKPLPFWQWLIAEVQGRHPDTVFLSEAFTRPKMMYRLAKIGFSQSYTYFTWRNHKQELTEYLTELDTQPLADYFRPNFFVNTPDINPYFLQNSGRTGFLIRAALATTTSSLWGMYSGFELCEARALPGREEYLDSEKYELRSWDWDRPGNIIEEISRLNQIRRTSPALQARRGIHFHAADDDEVLFFSRSTPSGDNVVLVAINLDPHAARSAVLELPLWRWGLEDTASVSFEDAWDRHRFTVHGKNQRVSLTRERPFLVWQRIGSL